MDPLTMALIFGAAFFVTDKASAGWLRAELGGGSKGAARGASSAWLGRRKRASKRRRAKRSKSKFGRLVNAVFDEIGALFKGGTRGYKVGRRHGHAKRRDRWQRKPPWWKAWFGPNEPGSRPNGRPERSPNGPNGRPERGRRRSPNGEPERPERPEREEGASPNEKPERKPEQAEGDPEREESEQAPRLVSTPNGTTVPNTRGASMVTDVTTAPQAIQAWEEIKGRFEEIKNELSQLADDAASTADSMGDFASGSEPDAVGAIETARDDLGSAEERVDAVISDLHDEWDEHISAAEGRTAGAHAAFQEA